ncbi:MAG TPA: hypothetical protein VJU16_05060, partial [Planctomycetota bacterium]|nr:hypothetical protein [Planctomycetota bacterium]
MGLRGFAFSAASRLTGFLAEPLRGPMRAWRRSALLRDSTPFSAEEIGAPAVVFAPHPDDETL